MGAMYSINNELRVMPGIKTQVVDPSGAGDIFHGAFAYCLANNFDLEKAITYSNIAAGLSVGKMGGRTSMPSLKEVITYYSQKFNIAPPVEEKKEEEIKEDVDSLPDIPDASTFQIPEEGNEDISFPIGGTGISGVEVNKDV